jgi:hypothetical protein
MRGGRQVRDPCNVWVDMSEESDNNDTETCESWEHDKDNFQRTVVHDFDLVRSMLFRYFFINKKTLLTLSKNDNFLLIKICKSLLNTCVQFALVICRCVTVSITRTWRRRLSSSGCSSERSCSAFYRTSEITLSNIYTSLK